MQFRYWAALIVQIFPENGDLWRSSPIYPNRRLAAVTTFLGFLMLKKRDSKAFIPNWHPVKGAICVKFPAVRLINF